MTPIIRRPRIRGGPVRDEVPSRRTDRERATRVRPTIGPTDGRGGLTAPRPISGDDTGGAPPVPIPNTAVKPARPMIVPPARKSVIAGSSTSQPAAPPRGGGLFLCIRLRSYDVMHSLNDIISHTGAI